jgi:outer membrane receptor for ferric coprogen and ferric-rhodotorulic acid
MKTLGKEIRAAAHFLVVAALLTPLPVLAAEAPAEEPKAQLMEGVVVTETLTDGATEGTGSYTTDAVGIGSRIPSDPRQLQQSVTVITAQRIQDQNLTTTAEALEQATGITVVPDTGGAHSTILSRGFDITSVQFDGGPPAVLGYGFDEQGLPDLAPYDHVEVLRGSDGLYSGSGEPGGSINLVRKRPLPHLQVLNDLSAGSWNRYRGQLDVTGPIASNERLRGRLVAAYEDRKYHYDVAEQDKAVVYGVLEADLSQDTVLTIGATHEHDNAVPNFIGLPRYLTGADIGLPRDTCLCTPGTFWNRHASDLFLKLEQQFAADWQFKLNVTRRKTSTRAKHLYPGTGVNPVTLLGPEIYTYYYGPDVRQLLVDATLNGSFDLLGHRQELAIGANWQDIDQTSDGGYWYLDDTIPVADVFDFDPRTFPDPVDRATGVPWGAGQRQSGIFASLRSEITGSLHSVLGLRFSNYRYHNFEGEDFDASYKDSGIVTPYGGLTFDLTNAVSLYGSYADTFVVQNLFTAEGERLSPIAGETIELGLKGSWQEGRLTGSLAAYKAVQENAGILDFLDITRPYDCCYISGPTSRRSRGIDLELAGEMLPGMQFSVGYTYNDNKSRTGDDAGRRFSSYTPVHLLKLWSMVNLPGAWSGWRVGAGLNAQSKSYTTGEVCDGPRDEDGECISDTYIPFDIKQGAYAVVGARVERSLGSRWKAALNIGNLLDRKYYASVGGIEGFNYYGAPRNFTLSLHGHF